MIPNIVHFVFGLKEQTEEFLFCYYLAVYSAFIVNNPENIFFYYHYEPFGKWWDKIKQIQCINLIKIDIPEKIGKKPIKKIAHKADWVRMNVLYQFGGIYLDIDSICVKPWKDLLNEKVVLATQIPIPGICNAIMMSEPQSEFFKIWLDKYEKPFNPDGWEESSIFLPLEIMITNFDKVTMKNPDTFFIPNFKETEKIFKLPQEIPKNLVALHLWESFSIKYMKNINDWNWCIDNKYTLYGKMMINLIVNYITNDTNVYFTLKKDFEIKENKMVCINDTNLKKNTCLNHFLKNDEFIVCKKNTTVEYIIDYTEDTILVKSNLNIEKKKLHIIHRNNKFNTGDLVSSCHNYYKFEDYNIIIHDIYKPRFEIIEKDDPIILSGGGLLDCLDIWNENINKLLDLSNYVFGWGIGLNKHNETEIKKKINYEKFNLLGIRDYNIKLNDNTFYVPCSSCSLPQLKKKYVIKRFIGICEHKEIKINLVSDYERIYNSDSIDKIIEFIGETEIIITNTYHCLYFCLLMNKKVILLNSFSEKFKNLKFNFKKCKNNIDFNFEKEQLQINNFLDESIEINDKFYEKILNILKEKN